MEPPNSGPPIAIDADEIQQRLASLSLNAAPGSCVTVNVFFGGDPGPVHPETSAAAGIGQVLAPLPPEPQASAPSDQELDPPPEQQESTQLSDEERTLLARSIGEWVVRALAGQRRGCSGRHKNPLNNRIWLVFKDIDGNEYNPVKVCKTWAEAAPLVKRGQELGDSVSIGMPTKREAQVVVAAAGKKWPS